MFCSWSRSRFVRSAVSLAVWCSVAFAALVVACLFTSAAWLAEQGQPGAAEGATMATEEEQLEEEEKRNVKQNVLKGYQGSQGTQAEEEEQEG